MFVPGPWVWSDGYSGCPDYPYEPPCVGPEDTDEIVCYLEDRNHTKEIWEANANLIAAAPDLLACLRWYVEHDETSNDPNDAFFAAGKERAIAAINKATGNQGDKENKQS